MDNKNDLILQLARMLQINESKSSSYKMPDKDYVKNAKDGRNFPQASELKIYLKSRLTLAGVDSINAKSFLLMPYSKEQWKVFVVDGNNDAYVQLDDYNGEIVESAPQIYCKDVFVIPV